MIIYSLIIRKEKSNKMEAKATYGSKWLLSFRKWYQNCNLTVPSPTGPSWDSSETVGVRELVRLSASLLLSLGLAVGPRPKP